MHRAKRTRTHVPTLFDLGVFSLRIYVTFLSVFGCAVYVDDYGKLVKEMCSPKHTHTHTHTNTHTHTHTHALTTNPPVVRAHTSPLKDCRGRRRRDIKGRQ